METSAAPFTTIPNPSCLVWGVRGGYIPSPPFTIREDKSMKETRVRDKVIITLARHGVENDKLVDELMEVIGIFNPYEPMIRTGGNGNGNGISAVKALTEASGLITFPANQQDWVHVVDEMLQEYGKDRAISAMRSACTRWHNTKNKNGSNYPKINLNWIAWAQEELAASPADLRQKDVKDMTSEEFAAYLERIGAE